MEQQLYLMRHAKAEPWTPLGNDFSRPLSHKGQRHASLVAAWASENLEPADTVLCSPARRTRETLSPFLSLWPQLLSVTDYVDSMYGASFDLLLMLASDAFSYSRRLLMVGHNPGFEIMLANMLKADQARDIQRMPTGTLAVIGFPNGFSGNTGTGDLVALRRGKDLSGN